MSNHGSDAADLEEMLQPIPEHRRTKCVWGQFWIWSGANVAPINWILGALGINLGLSLADTITVLVAGNLLGMLGFGAFVLLGQRTGVTGMVLSRAAFGRYGAYLPAAIQASLAVGWSAVNTWIILDLVMALFGQLGWVDPTAENFWWRLSTAATIMTTQVVICYIGYRAIAAFEKWTVPPTVLVLVAMSVVAWTQFDINWAYAGPEGKVLTGMPRLAAMSAVMTAIGIGWGIGWFTYAPDYSRFVSTSVCKTRLYLASTLGQFIPVVWLGVLGATLATKNGSADPGALIVSNFGVLAIPVLALVIHGPIATNIINLYTFGVAAQAMDIKISRHKLSIMVGVFAMLAVMFFMKQDNFAHALDSWLISIVAWVASWGGIMAVHCFVFERNTKNFDFLFEGPESKHMRKFNPAAMVAFFGGLGCTYLFMYGVIPLFQGPIAVAMGGVDLSWLAGGLSSAVLYYWLGRRYALRYSAMDRGQPAKGRGLSARV
ncbi:cytosine permease [Thauera sp. 2A1]|uniref:purine-cytosine permease family protein n=1 Tax=Thauera sp. 2A1 TaxID=2570191 RepID=UPI001D1760E3|nr:cytosine permease [Thauera sp. 2A1]KAI5914328.1 cytosine permease [Thauera sp. 2A1]